MRVKLFDTIRRWNSTWQEYRYVKKAAPQLKRKALNKYRSQGWGLSIRCLANLHELLQQMENVSVVEFGSGHSTAFLLDHQGEYENIRIVHSFDHDPQYSIKRKDHLLALHICDLEITTDQSFERMFAQKAYLPELMSPHPKEQLRFDDRNMFYHLPEGSLPEIVNLLILDGLFGNGRSLAFLHLKDHLRPGSLVVIDDFNHFDFTDRFLSLFPNATLLTRFESFEDNFEIWRID